MYDDMNGRLANDTPAKRQLLQKVRVMSKAMLFQGEELHVCKMKVCAKGAQALVYDAAPIS